MPLICIDKNEDTISLNLSEVQLYGICKLLGLSFNSNGTVTCFSDKGLKTIYDKTINKLKPID